MLNVERLYNKLALNLVVESLNYCIFVIICPLDPQLIAHEKIGYLAFLLPTHHPCLTLIK